MGVPDELTNLGNAVIASTVSNMVSIMTATFVSTEAVDTDLSKVTLAGGNPARWVPKLKSVGTMTVGDTLLMLSAGNQYFIIGIILGNVNLANAGM